MTHRIEAVKENAIINYIETSSGIGAGKVLWSFPASEDSTNQFQLVQPYIIVNIINGPTTVSGGELEYISTDTYKQTFHKEFTLSVKCFASENHLKYLDNIKQGRYIEPNRKILRTAFLGIKEETDIIDLTKKISTTFDRVGQFDMIMSYAEEVTTAYGQFDNVEAAITLDNRAPNNETI
jgi:hypothetical protein